MRLYKNNPRTITRKEYQRLQSSLDELGDLGCLVHDLNSDQVISGNQRTTVFDVSKVTPIITKQFDHPNRQGTVALGYIEWHGEQFAYRAVRWTEEQCQKANIIANISGGSWDWQILPAWPTEKLQAWGFDSERLQGWNSDAANLATMLQAEAPPDADAEPQIDRAAELNEKWQVHTGDLWRIGEHRLLCGDSTKRENVERVMQGDYTQLVVTDPPYGVSYADKNTFLNAIGRANCIETPIENDHATKEETQAMWKSAFEQMGEIMSAGAVVYCFMPQGGDQMMMMMMMMMGAGIEPRHELIWLKNNHVLGRVDYAYKHEPILYAWKEGGHKFYGDFQTSILEFPKPSVSDMHPTTKPTALIEKLILNSSIISQTVYDPFVGSGTTLVACQNLQRKCRAIEISPNYCAVILERMVTAFPGIEIERISEAVLTP